MKILIYGLNFYPELTGIGKFSGEMAAYLAAQGCEVRVVTAPPYYPAWRVHAGYHSGRYRREVWHGIQITRCPLWVPRQKSGLKRMLHLLSFAFSSFPAALAQVAWKPDLVFAVAPALTSAPFAWLAARLCGAKAWLHLQDLEVDAVLSLGLLRSRGLLPRLVYALEGWILRRFDRLSTISQAMAARVIAKGIPAELVTVFPNWADTGHITPLACSSPMRAELGLRADQFVVLYAGNLGEKQGLEVLLQAARQLRDESEILFLFVGDGAVRAGLAAQAADLGNVRFYPLQPLEKLNELLNLADVHILPQKKGAADLVMPSKLSGMLASGKAVIATAETGTELSAVIEQVGVLTPPEDSPALAQAILSLSRDPVLRANLGNKGREYALQNWSAGVMLNQMREAFEQMLANE